MTTINTLRKQYEKLTQPERLRAVWAAQLRGDDSEVQALIDTAPKKTYRMPDYAFLQTAFEHMAAVYLAIMLNIGGYLVLGIWLYRDRSVTENVEEGIVRNSKELLEMRAAWTQFCANHGQDPEEMITNVPGSGVSSPDGPQNGMLPMYLDFAGVFYDGDLDPANISGLIDALESVLKRLT